MKSQQNAAPSFNLRRYLYIGISLMAVSIAFITIYFGIIQGAILATIPLLIYALMGCLQSPYKTFTAVFIINYFVMGIVRYVPSLPGGMVLDALLVFTMVTLLIKTCYSNVAWGRARNGFTLISAIWLLYCIFEIFNPMGTITGWMRSVRGVAIYGMLVAILTPIIFYRYKDLKRIIVILSVLTLLAVAKAVIQKMLGFDVVETKWLFVDGAKSTHILYTGIRYFSIYTDAGNFGAGMGLAMVLFSITALYYKSRWMRFYFMTVAIIAAYGMVISGTRGALAVPFAGYTLYILLSRNARTIIVGGAMVIATFVVLNFTTLGGSISEIRRLRSAFNSDDASLQVRLKNQKLIGEQMKTLPFGAGLGMGGGKAKDYAPEAALSQIPTDSWFVMIWAETGIVGLVLHISLLLYVVGYGSYVVLFKLQDRQLRGITAAMTASIFGVMVASYGNEIWGQLPTALIMYMFQAFLFMSISYDKEIAKSRKLSESPSNTLLPSHE